MDTIQLIKLLRERPGMYIGQNSIFCLKAFIDGWFFRDMKEDINIEILNHFCSWLQEKYNLDDSLNWDGLLFKVFKDERKALDVFFILFDDFLKTSVHSIIDPLC